MMFQGRAELDERPNRTSVSMSTCVAAPASVVFDVLTQPVNHHRIDGSHMIRGVAGEEEDPIREVGATFSMRMRQVVPYRSVNTVVDFRPGLRLAWQTWNQLAGRRVIGGQIWSYDLEPVAPGITEVVQTYDWSEARHPWVIRVGAYPERMGAAMAETLHRLATVATTDPSPPS
ncbi:MAG: SRPBCC family protein [Actinomycetota bacterium]